MPFKSVTDAVKKHPNLDKYSAKAKRAFVHAFNSAFDGDEGKAFAIAYRAANKVDGKKAYDDIAERVAAKILETT